MFFLLFFTKLSLKLIYLYNEPIKVILKDFVICKLLQNNNNREKEVQCRKSCLQKEHG